MRVQAGIPVNDWRAAGRAAKAAEDTGYDGLISYEIAADPFTPLAFAALETERIELGTGIVVAFPRSPMVVAGISWDLQKHSRGRFHLGLGSQVKGHIERRFSTPWTKPVARMREYVESLRAIWRCWEHGEPLRYEGEHYRFTLMTPEFSPKPTGLPLPRVSIAAVGPGMLKLAGRVCDGVRLHGFATPRYVKEVCLPQIEAGLRETGRDRSTFEVWGGGFICTGADAAAVQKSVEETRYRIAFYGSTRTYHGVLAVHGWEELGLKLHAMSKRGEWKQMAEEVSDEVVHTFSAVAPYHELPKALGEHFGGITDTVALGFGDDVTPGLVRELIQDVRNIPSPFRGG